MGYTKWSDDAYSHLKSARVNSGMDDIFVNNRSGRASAAMLPKKIKFRGSRDSATHPESLSLAIFLDVTGSMGKIPEILVREKLGSLMNTLIRHGIEHPQILFGAIGDHYTDRFPLQAGQFESGTEELDQCLTELYIEGGGGGQNSESYSLAWLFCARHTSCDCFEKRSQKGFLFTIGDEKAWDSLDRESLQNIMGYTESGDLSDRQLLEEVQRSYHVFHVHINEASYHNDPGVLGYWKALLGERLLVLNDHRAIAETIAATVAVVQGSGASTVLSTFDRKTAAAVEKALVHISRSPVATKNRNAFSRIFRL